MNSKLSSQPNRKNHFRILLAFTLFSLIFLNFNFFKSNITPPRSTSSSNTYDHSIVDTNKDFQNFKEKYLALKKDEENRKLQLKVQTEQPNLKEQDKPPKSIKIIDDEVSDDEDNIDESNLSGKLLNTEKFGQITYKFISNSKFGTCHFENNNLRACSKDENLHSETLAHPVMLMHPFPRNVLVLGNEEGTIVRELLKHFTMKTVYWAGPEEEKFSIFKKNLPYKFDDVISRVQQSSFQTLKDNTKLKFDVVIVDLHSTLLNEDIQQFIYTHLDAGGVVCMSVGKVEFDEDSIYSVYKKISTSFSRVFSFAQFRPSHSSMFLYHIATNSDALIAPTSMHPTYISNWIERRTVGELEFYDSTTHLSLFNGLPGWIRDELKIIDDAVTKQPTVNVKKDKNFAPHVHVDKESVPTVNLKGIETTWEYFGCSTEVINDSEALKSILKKGLKTAHALDIKEFIVDVSYSLLNFTVSEDKKLDPAKQEQELKSFLTKRKVTAESPKSAPKKAVVISNPYKLQENDEDEDDEVEDVSEKKNSNNEEYIESIKISVFFHGGHLLLTTFPSKSYSYLTISNFNDYIDPIEIFGHCKEEFLAKKVTGRDVLLGELHKGIDSYPELNYYDFSDGYYINPKIESRSSSTQGTGQFALKKIYKGETVFRGPVEAALKTDEEMLVKSRPWKLTFLNHMSEQAEDDIFIAPNLYELDDSFYTNHNCDPNLWYEDTYDLMVARRDIEIGEELSYDYATIDAQPEASFDCKCGSPICRHKVTGSDWKIPELQERYGLNHFYPHVRKMIVLENRLHTPVDDDPHYHTDNYGGSSRIQTEDDLKGYKINSSNNKSSKESKNQ